MTFFLVYLYVYCLIFLPMVMHVHIKLMNTFGNWLMHMALISRTAFCCCKCLVPFGCCAGDDELESLTSARLSCE